MQTTETKIAIAGFGGQGIVLAGNILARAAVLEKKNVTGMVSYGVEMRGGTANATIVISDDEIASPVVERPDAAMLLNQPSVDRFVPAIEPGGVAIINGSLASCKLDRDDLDVCCLPAGELARSLGNIRVANITALGAFVAMTEVVKMSNVVRAIEDLFGSKKPQLLAINDKALEAGAKAAAKNKA
ncbi:Pyruvate synthase subunit PorC [Anaerohalosphaera lusitana]|uniref:Pyruvate synthase subunit PorC n=1 Tax=Anaerohalosphaera lusitana TaxID=1936003 RepID=A0A1U9NKT4_9BACT|nr:2-oxoacid:acceptor oxidoreductase family protein [Anaerohalosphaera lusitana]AQT68425.1 Pyruvate synthase subunit PorC [Anaerohalosphaera lusitana]